MEKRYQVFISSTKEDLEDARQEVSQALLRANCFPAAMELFPAVDEGISDYIKEVIRESDYYIVISAGKYGSIDPETGKSYTELEYDYAMEIGKPIIRLLHKDPFKKLTGEKIEQESDKRKRLEAFREKLTGSHLARFWDEPSQLTAEVVFGLQDAQRRKPMVGWVKADKRSSDAAEMKILELEKIVAELRLNISEEKKEIDLDELVVKLWEILKKRFELEFVDWPEERGHSLLIAFAVACYVHTNLDDIEGYFITLDDEFRFKRSERYKIFRNIMALYESFHFLETEPIFGDSGHLKSFSCRLTPSARRAVAPIIRFT